MNESEALNLTITERAILSVMTLDVVACEIAMQHLGPQSFYDPKHAKVFRAARHIYDQGQPVDAISITNRLLETGEYNEIGGIEFFNILQDEGTPRDKKNIETYCRIVIDAAAKCEFIGQISALIQQAELPDANIVDILKKADEGIRIVGDMRQAIDVAHSREWAAKTLDWLQAIRNRQGNVGIKTGFKKLDDLIVGFQASELGILAARPSMGKTSLIGDLIDYIAIVLQIPVLYFSVEMAKEEIYARWLCAHANVSLHRIKCGFGNDENFSRLNDAMFKISATDVFVDDTPDIDILELRSRARRMHRQHDIGIIFVDYLQLVNGLDPKADLRTQVTQVSRGLKALAKELRLPVVASAQLNRGPENRGKDSRPQRRDLRESGQIEQDADLIIFIHRERDREGHLASKSDIIVDKQRNGPPGSIELNYNGDTMSFRVIERQLQKGYLL